MPALFNSVENSPFRPGGFLVSRLRPCRLIIAIPLLMVGAAFSPLGPAASQAQDVEGRAEPRLDSRGSDSGREDSGLPLPEQRIASTPSSSKSEGVGGGSRRMIDQEIGIEGSGGPNCRSR